MTTKPPPIATARASISDHRSSNTSVLSDLDARAQASPTPTRRSVLGQPIVTAKFWKSRSGDAVFVTLKEWEGRPFCDVRQFYTDKSGVMQPSPKGLSVKMSKLPELKAAVDKAHAHALRLGLLGQPITVGSSE